MWAELITDLCVGGRRELRRVGQSTESGAAAASPPAGWGGRRGREPGQTLPRGTGSEQRNTSFGTALDNFLLT